MSLLLLIADRVLNQPMLISPEKAGIVLGILSGRIGVNEPDMSRFVGDSVERDANGRAVKLKPYRVSNGVGIITITGSLVNRGAWISASSGLTSYEGIQHQLKSALADDAVRSVILDMHSPGGEAVGTFETAAIVRQLAARKRTVAVVNGLAASAAYAIASGASEIVTTETGISGSIGVVLVHTDESLKLDREGVKVTLIHAGKRKVDGNPFEPLSEEALKELSGRVDLFYETFLKAVALGRGSRLSAAAARGTEARTFMGQEAVANGLADRLGSFESVLAELSRAGGRTPVQTRRSSMDNLDQPAANAGISQADHDRAVTAARAEGQKSGATAERDRFKAVSASEHFAGREKAAHHMLLTTEMSAEAITGVLANLPKESAQAAAPAAPAGARAKDAQGGLVTTAEAPTQPVAASWNKSVERVNSRIG